MLDLVEGDADPRVLLVASVGEGAVVVGDAAEIFDADVIDAAGEFAAGEGAAAEGAVERRGERGVEGERGGVGGGIVRADGGDGALPDEVAGAGGPGDAVFGSPAGEGVHAEVSDPRGGAGAADDDTGAGGEGGCIGHGEARGTDRDEGVGNGLAGGGELGAFAAAGNFDQRVA